MKKHIFIILLFIIQDGIKAQTVKLLDGTQVDIITTQAISSKNAKEGDQLYFQMAEDLTVDGKVVIKANSIVKGEISEVSRAKILGKAGKLEFTLDYAKAVDGQNIRLRASRTMEGKDNEAGAIAGAIIFAPLIFIKGKEAVIEKGRRFTVYIDRDYIIKTNISQELPSQVDSLNTESSTTKQTSQVSLADELKKLKELLDNGVLTKDEFDKAKKKILEKNN